MMPPGPGACPALLGRIPTSVEDDPQQPAPALRTTHQTTVGGSIEAPRARLAGDQHALPVHLTRRRLNSKAARELTAPLGELHLSGAARPSPSPLALAMGADTTDGRRGRSCPGPPRSAVGHAFASRNNEIGGRLRRLFLRERTLFEFNLCSALQRAQRGYAPIERCTLWL